MTIENEVKVYEAHAPMSVDDVHNQIQLIQQHMKNNMKEGTHYGSIPGCGEKKVLYKAGAEKLTFIFRLAPRYEVTKTSMTEEHLNIDVTCNLYHIATGNFVGEGVGSCSTRESKYRYRQGERKCPKCDNTTIIKGKAEYGGGWLCFAKKGGCGAKFEDGDQSIEGQLQGKIENPDIADVYNTVLKMAKKRALVDATLNATAASDIFTQDIADPEPEEKVWPDEYIIDHSPNVEEIQGKMVCEIDPDFFIALANSKELAAQIDERDLTPLRAYYKAHFKPPTPKPKSKTEQNIERMKKGNSAPLDQGGVREAVTEKEAA